MEFELLRGVQRLSRSCWLGSGISTTSSHYI